MEKYQLRSMNSISYVAILIPFLILFYSYLLLYNVDKNLVYILLPLLTLSCAYIIFIIFKDHKRKRIIEELISREDYRNIIVASIDERIGGRKNSYIYYVYICEDPNTKLLYESERILDIEESDIKIGDQVRLYESHTEKDIYWVDINHRESGKGIEKLSKEAREFGEESFKEVKKNKENTEKSKLIRAVIIFGFFFLFLFVVFIRSGVTYLTSTQTIGIVSKVEATNSTCGKHNYNCTIFSISVDLIESPKIYGMYPTYLQHNSSSAKGNDQPISLSKYKKGDALTILIENGNENVSIITNKGHIKEVFLYGIIIQAILMCAFGLLTGFFGFIYWKEKSKNKISS